MFELSDELVAEALIGDEEATNELLRRCQKAVYERARARLGVQLADDIAQETCIASAAVLGRYEDRGLPLYAVVWCIAANKMADV